MKRCGPWIITNVNEGAATYLSIENRERRRGKKKIVKIERNFLTTLIIIIRPAEKSGH